MYVMKIEFISNYIAYNFVCVFPPEYKYARSNVTFLLIRHHTSVLTKRKRCVTSVQMPAQVEHLCYVGDMDLCQEYSHLLAHLIPYIIALGFPLLEVA